MPKGDHTARVGGPEELLKRLGAHLPIVGNRLAGKVAVISGAGSEGEFLGIGAASAILFAAQGAVVGLLDVEPTRSGNTAAFIDALGGRSLALTADIRSAGQCGQAISDMLRGFGALHVLMNNAAIARAGTLETVTPQDWQASVDVNMTGTLLLSQAATPHLKENHGCIVNVSSIAAQRAHGVAIAYSASKAAIEAMTRDMALSLGLSGVRVNCLIPGMLHTPIGGGKSAQARERRRLSNLLSIEGSAWDAAWAALFLASDEARWITGTTLVVDAGSTIIPGTREKP